MTPHKERSPIEVIEHTRNLLAFLLVFAFVVFTCILLWKGIPEKNEQLLSYMLGQLSGMALSALGFYFVNKVGQDALDAKRSDNTKEAFKAISETAKAAGGPLQEPDVVLEPGTKVEVAAKDEVDNPDVR